MADIQNPSFEVEGASPGEAADWTESGSATAEDVIQFQGDDPAEVYPWEAFEAGWATGWATAFITTDLARVMFEGGTRNEESFEMSWVEQGGSGPPYNHLAIWAFGAANLEVIQFNGLDQEDFEADWDSNELWQTAFGAGDISSVSFDSGTPEAVEDFEEEWQSNENYQSSFSPTDLSAVSFDSAAPENVEDFEEEWTSTFVP